MCWWAGYEESKGAFERALTYYKKAQDYFSAVRILTFQNKIDEAKALCVDTSDPAASYQLARYYENSDNVSNINQYKANNV